MIEGRESTTYAKYNTTTTQHRTRPPLRRPSALEYTATHMPQRLASFGMCLHSAREPGDATIDHALHAKRPRRKSPYSSHGGERVIDADDVCVDDLVIMEVVEGLLVPRWVRCGPIAELGEGLRRLLAGGGQSVEAAGLAQAVPAAGQ